MLFAVNSNRAVLLSGTGDHLNKVVKKEEPPRLLVTYVHAELWLKIGLFEDNKRFETLSNSIGLAFDVLSMSIRWSE